jgi:Nif-specific regulatory protein
VGGNTPISVDVRIISATNRDIHKEVSEGRFREDLFYRLNVVQINMPTLCERKSDIALLAQHFLQIFKQERGCWDLKISEKAMAKMMEYRWPGNVRELRNAMERAVVMGNGKEIMPDDLPITGRPTGKDALEIGISLKEAEDRFKKEFIALNLKNTNSNRSRAARIMDIQRTYLSRLIAKYGLQDS